MSDDRAGDGLRLPVRGEALEWRGPAPHVFVRVGDDEAELLRELVSELSYGWGCIPCRVVAGSTEMTTALMPKDGGYLVPLKKALRTAEKIELGDAVELELVLPAPGAR